MVQQGKTRLRFPVAKSAEQESHISFQLVTVERPSVEGNLVKAAQRAIGLDEEENEVAQGDTDLSSNEEETAEVTALLERLGEDANISFQSAKVNFTGDAIKLYLPPSFQVSDGASYSSTSLGLTGAAAEAALLNGKSVGGAVIDASKAGISAFTDLVGNVDVAGASDAAFARAANTLRNYEPTIGRVGIPVGNVANAVTNVSRVVVDPNIRTMFEGVNTRSFNFAFKLIPTSPEEAQAIKGIIKFFRRAMYPEAIPGPGFNIGFRYPDLFKIRLVSHTGSDVGTPIKLSYLQSFSTNYNPSSPVLMEDGSPSEIDISMSFVEYKVLSRSDIDAEGTESFYSYNNVNPSRIQGKQ
jgi:hypothetical protein